MWWAHQAHCNDYKVLILNDLLITKILIYSQTYSQNASHAHQRESTRPCLMVPSHPRVEHSSSLA